MPVEGGIGRMTADVVRLLGQACTIMKTHGVSRAVLFGSQAKGRATPTSDIDLAFWPGPTFGIHDYFAIVDELDELETLRNWDLVDMTSIDPTSVIAQEVAEHGIELFSTALPAA